MEITDKFKKIDKATNAFFNNSKIFDKWFRLLGFIISITIPGYIFVYGIKYLVPFVLNMANELLIDYPKNSLINFYFGISPVVSLLIVTTLATYIFYYGLSILTHGVNRHKV